MEQSSVLPPFFQDRSDAGRRLADALEEYAGRTDVVVLGLPRGGVPVAREVAHRLHAPLDVLLVRKLGVPGHRELAMGAIAAGDVRVLNRDVIDEFGVTPAAIDAVTSAQRDELARRAQRYRDGRARVDLRGKTVILVDDGLATGATMRAAIHGVRAHDPARLVVAVPIASADVCEALQPSVDDLICLETPAYFLSVGAWYRDFEQTTDREVQAALDASRDASEA
ncbi:MAG: phosphoribosyltransferase [Caldilineaceae bacterium]|nr:phosphoribosyltransferase [Caldilineaceae bacterium]